MSNMQFYFAMAVPSILVILSWMQSNARLAWVESGIDRLDGRIDKLNERMDKFSERLDTLGERIDKLNDRVTSIEGDLRTFYGVTGKLEGRVEELSRR